MGSAVLNLIAGKDVPASNGGTYPVRNPLTGEVLWEAAASTQEDVLAAIEAAVAAQKEWATFGPSKRRAMLNKVADIIEFKEKEISETLSLEVSATPAWSSINVKATAGLFRESAALATHIKGEIVPADRPGTTIMVVREPAGVVFSISPWNAPLNLTARSVGAPLICGNSVIIKPSEFSPRSQRYVAEAIVEAGLPAGVITFLSIAPQDAPKLCDFIINPKCLKPTLLELGGKAPVLVLDNTSEENLEEAVSAVVYGVLMNSGQICMSTERVIVANSIADTFTAKLKARMEKIKTGNHLKDPSVDLSGLIHQASADRCIKLLKEAVEAGATPVLGDFKANGTIVQPHILDNVTNTMRAFVEESFGPMVAITRVNSDEEAVRVANDTDYSLTAAVFCSDVMRALKAARGLRYGSAHINGPTLYIEAPLPNGGIGGGSGYGRFGGTNGIHEFTDQKIITLSETGAKYPL